MEHLDNTTVTRPVTQPGLLSRWLAVLRDAMEQAASRRDLAALDDRMLADIGLSRGEALHEAGRPFLDRAPWRADSRKAGRKSSFSEEKEAKRLCTLGPELPRRQGT